MDPRGCGAGHPPPRGPPVPQREGRGGRGSRRPERTALPGGRMTRPGPPLLLVGHGTRSAAGVAEFGRLIDRVRERGRDRIAQVDGGFIELSAPSIADIISRMAAGTAGSVWEVVAVPLVLTAAGHGKGDIPAPLAPGQVRAPGRYYRH